MCINRETKPITCCCGCTLTCGIITYFVFCALGLISAIASMCWWSISMAVLEIVPVIALYFANESKGVRMWNYIQQCVFLGITVILLIAAIVGIEALVDMICNNEDVIGAIHSKDNTSEFGLSACEDAIRLPVYVVWTCMALIFVPIQIMWVRVFKAYLDELPEKNSEEDYAPIPTDDIRA